MQPAVLLWTLLRSASVDLAPQPMQPHLPDNSTLPVPCLCAAPQGALVSAFARSVAAHVKALLEPNESVWDPEDAKVGWSELVSLFGP